MARDLNLLHPKLKELVPKFIQGCKADGIDIVITCTGRDYLEQVALFAQGRQPLDEVNILRKAARMQPITLKQNKYEVTWTLASRHIIRLDDTDTHNDYATAFDFAIVKDNKPMWDVKASVDDDDIPDYLECARVAKKLGLEAGGFWRKADYPHVQLYAKDL